MVAIAAKSRPGARRNDSNYASLLPTRCRNYRAMPHQLEDMAIGTLVLTLGQPVANPSIVPACLLFPCYQEIPP